MISRGGYIESPVQRNVCGSTVDVMVSHIVLCDKEELFNFDMRLLNAPREWHDPKAARTSLTSGYDISAVILDSYSRHKSVVAHHVVAICNAYKIAVAGSSDTFGRRYPYSLPKK